MDSFEPVWPTEEELSRVTKNATCSECSATFNCESNLNLHLAKTHKKAHLMQSTSQNKIYYCPVTSCNYNSNAHFKQLKYLKQHYLKVHLEKTYVCALCDKGFSTETFKNRHMEYCNVIFKCCDCDMFYNCYETLKTHSRRKKHNIFEKTAYKEIAADLQQKKSKVEGLPTNKTRLILPKPSTSTQIIIISDTLEQSSQTERENTQQYHQETQTLKITKIPQLTVETQTTADYFVKKSDSYNSILKSAKTQTCTDPKTVSCNTTFSLEDFDLHVNDVERSSSSTQTAIYNDSDYIYSTSTSTHDSIYTDTSDLLIETFDQNFFNCNMETQTDMFQDELFRYCDDYSNTYTQTCEDLFMGLSNIQTQTIFDDLLKSVESQTIVSQSKKVPLSCKDMSHMETQTDMHFKKMLEEINA